MNNQRIKIFGLYISFNMKSKAIINILGVQDINESPGERKSGAHPWIRVKVRVRYYVETPIGVHEKNSAYIFTCLYFMGLSSHHKAAWMGLSSSLHYGKSTENGDVSRFLVWLTRFVSPEVKCVIWKYVNQTLKCIVSRITIAILLTEKTKSKKQQMIWQLTLSPSIQIKSQLPRLL